MKKIIMAAVMLGGITLFNNTYAQVEAVGIKGGINFANVSNFGNNTRVAGNVGFFVHAQINKNWCVQPEILYSAEGARFMSTNGERTLALNYVQVPVMFQYFPVKQLYLELGPQVGLLTNADVKNTNNGNKYSVSDGYKKGDVDLNVGIGVKATPNVGIFARYSFGLANISTDNNYTYHNNVGQVGAFIRFARY